jgi:SagB-type dehydrogenase family enzyme
VADGGARAAASLSRDTIARLLFFANGDTGTGDGDPYRLRAAPSAGALYVGEVYVVARRVEGLDAGVYYYDVGRHALVRVGKDARLEANAIDDPDAERAPALVCVTNVFERYERRYANRGYRYALIDTGHIGENLRLAAISASVPISSPGRYHDEAIERLLGVDGREEAVCAVHVLGGGPGGEGSGEPSGGEPDERSGAPGATSGVLVEKQETAEEALPRDLAETLRYHMATKLVPAPAAPSRPSPAPARAASSGARIALPAGEMAIEASVEACIRERRSPPGFAGDELALETASAIFRLAQPATRRAVAVDLYLVAHRVRGLEPGLYRYAPAGHALEVLARADLSERMVDACLGQDKAGDAAAGALMVASLDAAARLGGERAYRDVLIDAGAIGQRLYLAAEALGVSARNLAAYLDDQLNELAGLDGRSRAVVHLTMLGRQA